MTALPIDVDLPEGMDYETEGHAVTEMEIEEHLRCIVYWRDEKKRYADHADKMVLKAQEYKRAKTTMCQQREEWHKHAISCYLATVGKRRLALVNGSVWLANNPDRLSLNRQEFMERPTNISFCRTVVEPDMDKIKDYIEATGEVPAGVEVIAKGESLRVKLAS